MTGLHSMSRGRFTFLKLFTNQDKEPCLLFLLSETLWVISHCRIVNELNIYGLTLLHLLYLFFSHKIVRVIFLNIILIPCLWTLCYTLVSLCHIRSRSNVTDCINLQFTMSCLVISVLS